MAPSVLTAESVASVVASYVTIAAIVVGLLVAAWKLILQQPLGINFDISTTPCRLRVISREGAPTYAYTICVMVHNHSAAIQRVQGWWRKLVFPSEVGPDYDPDGTLDVDTLEEAESLYGEGTDGYDLAPGETMRDEVIRLSQTPPEELCYVEVVLSYRCWKGQWWRRWRRAEYRSQILMAPIEREDIQATKGLSSQVG